MKKLLTILLTLLMIFTLVGCNSSSIEEQPISKEDQPTTEVETPKEEDIVGGYTDVEDKTVTDELKQLFDSALEGLIGATYEPLELVATQVVAGTNYKFKASGTKTTNPVTKGTYYITIYKDLQGNVSLLDIEVIEETQEEAKEETIKLDSKDLSNVSFWVVFYNPDGSELYRTTLKYGQTPTYKGSTPSYWDSDYFYKFVCWTDKQGNEIKEFKPITGNTYIFAKYKMGGDLKEKDDNTIYTPPVIPNHTEVECLTSSGGTNGSYINSKVTFSSDIELIFEAKMTKSNWSRPFGYYFGTYNGVLFQTTTYGFNVFFGNGNGDKPYGGDINKKIVYDVIINSGSIIVKLDGSTLSNDACANPSAQNITIFSLVGLLGDVNDQPLSMYSMKIKKDGVLERDFIPVRTNKEIDMSKNATDPTVNIPADTLCFYDKLNDLYYLNSGSVPFTDVPIS